jgi:hypothetical protein
VPVDREKQGGYVKSAAVAIMDTTMENQRLIAKDLKDIESGCQPFTRRQDALENG